MSLIRRVDDLASLGESPWHRASAIGKLALALLLIGASLASHTLSAVLALQAIAWVLVLTARFPWRIVVAAAAYPLAVSALFVLVTWGGPLEPHLVLLARPVTATLAVLWLIGTTPYPDLFAPLSRVLPRSLGDGLFLTYRALFDLLARAERLHQARRMRGGDAAPAARRLVTAGEGLGTLVVLGFERSQRLYSVMLLRGHSGRVCGCRHWAEVGPADLWVALAGVLAIAAALGLRSGT